MATTFTNGVASVKYDTSQVSTFKATRLFALDSTKGALVLTMVLYHWLNYFVAIDPSLYRYLRFLTPSFIFITGFLISYVYLRKDPSSTRVVSKRLFVRGLKLVAIVLVLNSAPALIANNALRSRNGNKLGVDLLLASLTGTKAVAFSVLVPIGYLLIASGLLLPLFRRYRGTFHVACALSLVSSLSVNWIGVDSSYLQLFSIGALGISIGHFQIDKVHRLLQHRIVLVLAYAGYVAAISVWNATYTLQIIGVCLSVSLIYVLATWCGDVNYVGRTAILLGKYSLFAYIIQIVILQILSKVSRLEDGIDITAAAFLICIVATIASVKVVEWSRARSRTFDVLYSAVFC